MSMTQEGQVRLMNTRFRSRIVCAAAAMVALIGALPQVAHAQALGAITGTVTDSSGASIPKAKITATEVGTGFERSILSDDAGHYTVPNLRPTEYNLTVEAAGFRR